jgi:hypothetical protein
MVLREKLSELSEDLEFGVWPTPETRNTTTLLSRVSWSEAEIEG